jgi:ParB-like chromosome segregation protein Spo0J
MADAERRSLQLIKISELKPAARNARTHSKRQIKQIADSIKRFGFTNAILIDSDKKILAGHGRVQAAESLGISDVPCVCLSLLGSTGLGLSALQN